MPGVGLSFRCVLCFPGSQPDRDWRDRYGFKAEDYPVAYDVYRRAVSLPIYPKMTDEDVEKVIGAVRNILS